VVRAIVEAATGANRYPTSASSLKRRLASREGLEESNVLLGAGSTELIDVVIRSFVGPGEEVLLSVPTFSMYEARTRVVGGIPVLVPLTEQAQPDVGGMIRAVTERTKVIFLCTPNNPTGTPVSESELLRVVRLGLPTVVDEAYWELGDQRSFAHLLHQYPNVMVLRTFSKAFGLAGLRLGYAFAHGALINLLSRVKVPWNISTLALCAAEAALEDFAELDARIRATRASRAWLVERLAQVAGLQVLPSDGNFVLVDISSTGWTAGQLVDAVLAEGVLIRSLEVHHATKHFVRITVGTPEQNARCVDALETVLSRPSRLEMLTGYAAASSDAE
jgi:histidinol-phosphate aminotransferase